jgi:Holliday junction resolvasome RuvABC ATP-dependent DNA helicase subunit
MNQQETYRHYLSMLKSNHVNSVLCFSKAGLGKTHTTISMLKEMQIPYMYTSGVATAVSLYKMLYDSRDKVLILDDIETLFQDDKIINILKAALWEVDGRRQVSYNTSSKVLEDYPHDFTYNGKIIILSNEIRGKYDESFKALMSRCLKYELVYTFSEIIEISKLMVNQEQSLTPTQKEQTINIIVDNIRPEHNFNFRLLQRLMSFVKYNSDIAEMLFMQSIEVDSDKAVLLSILRKDISVEEQVKEFTVATGQSRMTFFRRKKQLKAEAIL